MNHTSTQNINSQVMQNNVVNSSMNHTSSQCQATSECFEQPALVQNHAQDSVDTENGALNSVGGSDNVPSREAGEHFHKSVGFWVHEYADPENLYIIVDPISLLFVSTVVSMSASLPSEACGTIHGKSEVSLALPSMRFNHFYLLYSES
ncbi:hypothetical protein OIU84_006936 [Salix udensis]|uniref:Uncharacterized protein n=1 Tax=Salix udensis TaxID=889485 RepID=A0AAD6P2S4_9ROSI|nr:hypothetical protein OIU84_006936 [Salix udensis]